MEKRTSLISFDNLECLSVLDQKTAFPSHYHETYCITLVYKGIEKTKMNGHDIFCESGSISIAHPYEIHSNPLTSIDSSVQFETIYISQDLIRFLLNGKIIHFFNRVITNQTLSINFINLKEKMDVGNEKLIEIALKKFIQNLVEYGRLSFDFFDEKVPSFNHNIHEFIRNNLKDKLTLDVLSRLTNMDKYNFVKKFKIETGMTPINYVLMKKIFSAKNEICKDNGLTDIAYAYDFSDLAHFSKTFKRFIGIAPKVYQNRL